MRSGNPIPDRILNAPRLTQCLEFFYDSFWVLNSCRSMGMTLGPIPVTAIIQYGKMYDCEGQLLDDLVDYVLLLDQIFLQRMNANAKKKK